MCHEVKQSGALCIFHPCLALPYSCFTPLAPHFCSKELPFLIKEKYRHLRLSDTESWRTRCFPKSHFPFHQQYKFILFSVISVKRVRNTIAIHMSTPALLPQPLLEEILTSAKTESHRTFSESHSTTHFNLDLIDPMLACRERVIKVHGWVVPALASVCHTGACH